MTLYFEAIKQKDFESALALYSPEFFEKTEHEEWLQVLNNINTKLGDLQSYKQTGWRVTKRIGTGSGTYYDIQYEVTYSKYPATEKFNLFQPISGGDTLIMGHFISSKGFILD